MADSALSVSSSALATLLATGGESATGNATAAPSDPFAALLAGATGATGPIASSAGQRSGDAGKSLPPVGAPAAKVLMTQVPTAKPTDVPSALVVDSPPVDAEGESASFQNETGTDGDRTDKDKVDDKSDDPLAAAIASGATAVLALAPTIVTPSVAAPVVAPTPVPYKVDAPAATAASRGLPAKSPMPGPIDTASQQPASQEEQVIAVAASPLATSGERQSPDPSGEIVPQTQPRSGSPAEPLPGQTTPLQPQIQTQDRAQMQRPLPAAAPIPAVEHLGMASERADVPVALPQSAPADSHAPVALANGDAPQPHSQSSAKAQAVDADGKTLSPEPARTVTTMLRQDAGSSDIATMLPEPSQTAAPAAPPAAAPSSITAVPQATAQSPKLENAPVQAPARRRAGEATATERSADARRRTETTRRNVPSPDLGQAPAAVPHSESAPATNAIVQAKGDTVVQQTLSIARDGAWLDRLARDIASAGNGGDLQFKLDPQHLGALTVAISQGADGASIRLTADNDATRNLLLDAQPKLIAEAHAQGLRISDTRVDINENQTQNQNQNQSQNQSAGQQQSHAQAQNQGGGQDPSRWTQGNAAQQGNAQNGQNRQSSPAHQPFVSNLRRKAEANSESSNGDSGALYA